MSSSVTYSLEKSGKYKKFFRDTQKAGVLLSMMLPGLVILLLYGFGFIILGLITAIPVALAM